jgi:hypothetical protein
MAPMDAQVTSNAGGYQGIPPNTLPQLIGVVGTNSLALVCTSRQLINGKRRFAGLLLFIPSTYMINCARNRLSRDEHTPCLATRWQPASLSQQCLPKSCLKDMHCSCASTRADSMTAFAMSSLLLLAAL